MLLTRIQLRFFRNIDLAEIVPSPGFNILWGDNAQGKTNFLEAVYLLGNLKSFRGARNEEMVGRDQDFSRIRAGIISHQVIRTLEMSISRGGKKIRVNGKELRQASDFFGLLRPVIFSPEEVGIAKGAPGPRRELLDRAVFQADSGFLSRAKAYEQHLKQRNRLLKDNGSRNDLLPWTEGMIKTGARLRLDRYHYVRRITPFFREVYREIAGGEEDAVIAYPSGHGDEEILRNRLADELIRLEEREYRQGQTLAGPHRDDIDFSVNGQPLRLYGSQGQQRSFILAFKAAQIMDLEVRTGEPPVLLLDDMTSELDRHRQSFFFRFLQERQGQVFITTTDLATLKEAGLLQARYFHLVKGKIEEYTPS
jgi:DNA replication and repair protein RecF